MQRWLVIIGVVAGATAVILYFTSPELFAPPEDKGPIAVAAPPPTPTEQALTETPVPTPEPATTEIPATVTREPTLTPTVALEPASTPDPTAEPTPPPLLLSYGGWKLDCPGCPVVVLDTKEPEVIGTPGLDQGDTVRVAGCTRAQTTVRHRYVFEAVDGNFSGVAIFDPEEHPGAVPNLECFEMLGEYLGTDQYAVSVQLVDNRWEYDLIQGQEARAATGPEWEPAGTLMGFAVGEWVSIAEDEYAMTVRIRTDPAYAAGLAALVSGTPTLVPALTPEPTSTPEWRPTPAATPVPTRTPRSTSTPRPTSTPKPTPTPAPVYEETLASAKQLMLELINAARADAGSPPVVLGNNRAAQVHADNTLASCFSGHWGMDGTKPNMRYALAGGYQANAENVAGLDVCIRAGQGYAANRSVEYEVREAMRGFMGSSGHRRTIVDPAYQKVNIGLAWDRFNFQVVQQFEGDYVEYSRAPAIEGDRIAFEGRVKNGAVFGQGQWVHVQIAYHPPLYALTRGQVVRTYCASSDRPVAYLRKPLTGNRYYPNDTLSTTYPTCVDPRGVPPDAPAPQSYPEARALARETRAKSPVVQVSASMDAITASRWKVSEDNFFITADIEDVLDEHGPGIYTVILFGILDGDPEVISEYPIFHGVPRPPGYD